MIVVALRALPQFLPQNPSAPMASISQPMMKEIRGGLFVLMLVMLFGIVGGKKGFVVYHFMNPFNLFNLQFETPTILLTVILALGLSLAIYRPFCQFICPFGFVSWLAERFSLVRVRVDHDRCGGCGACAVACPLDSAQHIVDGKWLGADCYSCARCLRVCPDQAIEYRSVWSGSKIKDDSNAEAKDDESQPVSAG